MARLIRTEKEVEGRFEEVWIVVEEDPLEQWPAGPLAVVGRPAPRKDGHERVRGEARYTADLKLPGMLHAAVLRSPHAHARVRRIDLAPALALPGVRAAIGPGEAPGLEEEAGFSGAAVAAVAADTFAPGARGSRGDRDRVGGARGRARSGRRRPARAPHRRGATAPRARRRRARARRGGRRRRGRRTARRPSSTTRSRPTRPCASGRATRSTSTSRRSSSGASGRRSPASSACPRTRCASSASTWAAASARRTAPTSTRSSPRSSRSGRADRCAAPSRGARRTRPPATATRRSSGSGPAPAATGRSSRFDGEFTNSVGWSGWNAGTEGPMQMLYDCENVRTVTHGARLNTPPMKAFRAPGFVEGTFGLECLVDELAARLDIDPLELRRRNYASSNDGHAVLLQEPRGVLPDARSRTGSGGTRCARAPTPSGSAAWGWRARSGTAAAGLLPTRGCDSARTAARR